MGAYLSRSMQGAGGVGGLLAETHGTNHYYPTYDGNGNISEYLDSTGSITAHFEYDPFGNAVVNNDTSNQFDYRFSTKPLDFETGLYYYGYRYYDPLTGRWPSRDPIEERGGVNLYGFDGNDGVSYVDSLGLWTRSPVWSGKRGKYVATVCAENGDTWNALILAIVGTTDGVSIPKGKPVANTKYPVGTLLSALETRLRRLTVHSIGEFKSKFENKRAPFATGRSGDINKYFTNNAPGVECFGAADLVIARGVIKTITAAKFDKLYKLSDFSVSVSGKIITPGPMLEVTSVNSEVYMFLGDWGYIESYQNYDANKGPWQGENIIKIDNGKLWGHGTSADNLHDIEKALKTHNNSPGFPGKFGGLQTFTNKFTKVSKLGMDLFDLEFKKQR